MSRLISDEAIKRSTGDTWNTWLDRLNEMGAANLSHKEIATKLVAEYQVPGWWAQSLTVRYEQAIGRRQPGQSNTGDFSVSISKTLGGSMDEALHWWLKKVQARTDFNGIMIESSSTTETEKWRHYRAALQDGSRIVIGIYAKTPAKAGFGLQHSNLPSDVTADTWRTYWKAFVSNQQ